MPTYVIKNQLAEKVDVTDFNDEKDLQNLVEKNLEKFFSLRFIATEYWTGGSDGGYIDTLALDENNSPVIIEYKWGENENVINQGLYYIDQILEHKGDLESKIREVSGKDIKIDWKQPKLITIARSYNRYDQHAVKRISGNIELVRYSKLENNLFNLETVYSGGTFAKKPSMDVPSSKVATSEDPLKERLDWIARTNPNSLKLYTNIRESILSLDENIIEKRYKNGSQFKVGNKMLVAVAPWQNYIRVYLDVTKKVNDPKKILRSNIGKGKIFKSNYDFQVNGLSELDYAMGLIKQAYKENL